MFTASIRLSGLSDMKESCNGCKSCIIMLFTQQQLITISEMVSKKKQKKKSKNKNQTLEIQFKV